MYIEPFDREEVNNVSRKYELLYALNPTIGEDALDSLNQRIQDLVASQGEILKIDVWGRRRLAYEIEDETEGYYVLINFKSEPDFPIEVNRILRITDNVLRYLVTTVDE
ncbi:MAG: 30S ribosomal protein S6 [Clostridiaceae bacterium]|nr:30S ribosomal protein S6 [Clostridiaceae bacterium]